MCGRPLHWLGMSFYAPHHSPLNHHDYPSHVPFTRSQLSICFVSVVVPWSRVTKLILVLDYCRHNSEKLSDDIINSLLQCIDSEAIQLSLQLEAVQSQITTRLCEVRRRRNLLVPIHRLHVELLSDIFLLVAEQAGTERAAMRPVNITEVCTLWREITLGTPRFWSSVTEKTLFFSTELITRSKSAPLDVYLSDLTSRIQTPDILQFATILTPEMYRSRTINLSLSATSIEAILLPLSKPAPRLEELTICPRVGTGRSDVRMDLLGNYAPSLRRLTLDQIAAPWTSSIFKNLTSLRLARHRVEFRPSMEQFSSVLTSCPNLEELALHYSGPSIPANLRDDQPEMLSTRIDSIQLKNLRILELETDEVGVIEARFLMEHIIAPPTLYLSFAVSNVGGAHDLSDLFPRPYDQQGHHHLRNIDEIQAVTCKVTGTRVFRLSGYPSHSSSKPILEVELGQSDPSRIFSSLGAGDVKFPSLQSISIEHFTSEIILVRSWESIFTRHPSITHLSFSVCVDVSQLFNFLSAHPDVCPSLERISLSYLHVPLESLHYLLKSRRLKRLDIRVCGNIDAAAEVGFHGLVDLCTI
jgi:hypothetical protein